MREAEMNEMTGTPVAQIGTISSDMAYMAGIAILSFVCTLGLRLHAGRA